MSGIQETPRQDALEMLKTTVISDIGNDRKMWRMTEIPQLLTLFLLMLGLSIVAGYGLYTSVMTMSGGIASDNLLRVIQIFVTGSSSLLGFIVFKLLKTLAETTSAFIAEEKRFTSDANMVRVATSTEEIKEVLKDYYKIATLKSS